jgi:two-component system chemotaxis response regulator CheY
MALGEPNMKILIADDMPVMRKIIKQLLKQLGYNNFVEVENGDEAYKTLQAQPDIEFIFSDWNMPEMTGLEFLITVRRDARFKHLPFLMITAEAEKENIIEAVKAGVSNYVVKPFNQVVLAEKMNRVLAQYKKAG